MFYMSEPIYVDGLQSGGAWGLCRLDHEGQYGGLLTKAEKVEYERLTATGRKREWLAARVALKRIVIEAGYTKKSAQCQIDKDRFGRPRITVMDGNAVRALNCSISHKKGIAAVSVGFAPEITLGIDVETVSEKPMHLRNAFVRKDDSLYGIAESPKYYAFLWACKEAASKAMGLGMLQDFRELRVIGRSDKRFSVFCDAQQTIHGTYLYYRGFIVAMAHLRPTVRYGSDSLFQDGIRSAFHNP